MYSSKSRNTFIYLHESKTFFFKKATQQFDLNIWFNLWKGKSDRKIIFSFAILVFKNNNNNNKNQTLFYEHFLKQSSLKPGLAVCSRWNSEILPVAIFTIYCSLDPQMLQQWESDFGAKVSSFTAS